MNRIEKTLLTLFVASLLMLAFSPPQKGVVECPVTQAEFFKRMEIMYRAYGPALAHGEPCPRGTLYEICYRPADAPASACPQ